MVDGVQLRCDLDHLGQTGICDRAHFLRTGGANDSDDFYGTIGDSAGLFRSLAKLHRVEMGLDEVFASSEENREHKDASEDSL